MKRSPLLLLVFALACADVPVDEFEFVGGTAPEPTGVLRGTVLYSGPKPICGEDLDGNTVPLGQVILTLFEYDNPPPPTGSASSAANLLTIPGVSLFSGVEDCLTEEDDPREFITRTAEFAWPELPLGHAMQPADYQIRGFYDYDGNFNPFFSVTNLPTQGDIAGGAFVDPNATIREYRRLRFDSVEERPNGQVINGVSVALGAPVTTERPVFWMESDPLNSAQLLPTGADSVARENMIFSSTNTIFHLYNPDDTGWDALAAAFAAAGMPLDQPEGFSIGDLTSNYPHAWYVRPVDADGDGELDLHPTLGAAEPPVNWFFPVVLMQRARTAVELQAGVPDVLLIATVSIVDTLVQGRRAYDDDLRIGVPALAAVNLNPADARCRIPYIPPGNVAPTYERITVECQEVPTGDYAVNVIHGLAGAGPIGSSDDTLRMCTPPDTLPSSVTPPSYLAADGCFNFGEAPPGNDRQIETCNGDNFCAIPSFSNPDGNWDLQGGSPSGQAWGIPNALGDPDQLPDLLRDPSDPTMLTPEGELLVEQQGEGGMFTVEERNPANEVGTDAECAEAPDEADTTMNRAVQYKFWDEHGDDAEGLRDTCCEPIVHLCNIPLCDLVASRANPDSMVRAAPTTVDDGGRPNCMPFEIPDVCCGDAVP
ncbi:MAG: hypothetical protein JJ863_14625 [Deltaproteobacteria bacterium]|nr:hypothetical protein [Deltaproteobacteria bacterium]